MLTKLNLGLRQFEELPDNSTVLIQGPCNSGRTAFAAYIAKQALLADRKVSFISTCDRLLPGVVMSTFTADMLATSSGRLEFLHLMRGDGWRPYTSADVTRVVKSSLNNSDVVVVDDIWYAYFMAADRLGNTYIKHEIEQLMLDIKMRRSKNPQLLVMTIQTPKDTAESLTDGVTQYDPVPPLATVYPMPREYSQHFKTLYVDMVKVAPALKSVVL